MRLIKRLISLGFSIRIPLVAPCILPAKGVEHFTQVQCTSQEKSKSMKKNRTVCESTLYTTNVNYHFNWPNLPFKPIFHLYCAWFMRNTTSELMDMFEKGIKALCKSHFHINSWRDTSRLLLFHMKKIKDSSKYYSLPFRCYNNKCLWPCIQNVTIVLIGQKHVTSKAVKQCFSHLYPCP